MTPPPLNELAQSGGAPRCPCAARCVGEGGRGGEVQGWSGGAPLAGLPAPPPPNTHTHTHTAWMRPPPPPHTHTHTHSLRWAPLGTTSLRTGWDEGLGGGAPRAHPLAVGLWVLLLVQAWWCVKGGPAPQSQREWVGGPKAAHVIAAPMGGRTARAPPRSGVVPPPPHPRRLPLEFLPPLGSQSRALAITPSSPQRSPRPPRPPRTLARRGDP